MSDITPLQKERIKNILRRANTLMLEEQKQQQLNELRLKKIIRHLILEAEEDVNITSTGIAYLERALEAIHETSKDAYKLLKTTPEQRKAFLKTWEWLFKEMFFGDVKKRNAIEKAAKKIGSEGFTTKEEPEEVEVEATEELVDLAEVSMLKEQEEKEEEDKVVMKVTDPDLVKEPKPEVAEKTEEEEEEEFIDDLASAPAGSDRTGQAEAVRLFAQTRKQVFNEFDQLAGEDAEYFYKWFFINMLGSDNSGFSAETGDKVLPGHFQRAELELKEDEIETDPELLPPEDPETYNLGDADF